MIRFDDDIAESRAGRNVDFQLAHLLLRFLREHRLVRIDARFPFRVASFRRHANPLQLALERFLSLRFRFLLAAQTFLLLLQPRRVVPLPRNSFAAVELENPAGHVVEEVPIMRHGDDRSGILLEMLLEPSDRFGVEMIRRFVEQKDAGLL